MGSQDYRTHDDDGGGGDGELTLLGETVVNFMQQMDLVFEAMWRDPRDAAAWRCGDMEYLVHLPRITELRLNEYDGPSTERDVELAEMELAKLFDRDVWDRPDVAVLVGDLLAGEKALWIRADRILVATPNPI